MPGRIVSRATYAHEYSTLTKETGIPFVPDAAWKDAIFAAAIMLAVIACALLFGPFGPTGQPDPTIIQTAPKPDFAFLWIYSVLAYLPPSLETPVLFIAPILVIGAMLLLPLVAGEGEKHWSRRPVAVLMVAVIAVTLGVLTRLGTYTPWSPIMNAWTSDPIPTAYLHNRTPLEREGTIVFQNKQCRNCHSVGGEGGGNMPAYGNSLSPSETTALVRFLTTLRGNDLAPAIDASRHMVLSGKLPSTMPNGH
jgi:ubiquinol-cytochrome c reductase cytochrome b subunit